MEFKLIIPRPHTYVNNYIDRPFQAPRLFNVYGDL